MLKLECMNYNKYIIYIYNILLYLSGTATNRERKQKTIMAQGTWLTAGISIVCSFVHQSTINLGNLILILLKIIIIYFIYCVFLHFKLINLLCFSFKFS